MNGEECTYLKQQGLRRSVLGNRLVPIML